MLFYQISILFKTKILYFVISITINFSLAFLKIKNTIFDVSTVHNLLNIRIIQTKHEIYLSIL